MSAGKKDSAALGLLTLLLGALLLSACTTNGKKVPYLWVDDLPVEVYSPGIYRIASRDVISVRVWNQEAMSLERARVRDDGKISLPFLHDVPVSGMTPNELSEKLQNELVSVIVDPVVTVTVDEPALVNVSVLGEVRTAGTYTMPRPAGLLHAIAAAGGLTQYASNDGIYILRRLEDDSQAPVRIRFHYRELTSGGTRAAGFLLKTGDVLVVE